MNESSSNYKFEFKALKSIFIRIFSTITDLFDEDRSLLARNESRGDDIHIIGLLGKQCHLSFVEHLGHVLGIASSALTRFLCGI